MDTKQYYIRNWTQILTHLLYWTRGEVRHWIETRFNNEELNRMDSEIYHFPPAYWIIEPIIQAVGIRPTYNQFMKLEKELLIALDAAKHDFTNTKIWRNWRQSVNRVLARYDAKLPVLDFELANINYLPPEPIRISSPNFVRELGAVPNTEDLLTTIFQRTVFEEVRYERVRN